MNFFYAIRHSMVVKHVLLLFLLIAFVLGSGFYILYRSVHKMLKVLKSKKGMWCEPFPGQLISDLISVYACPIFRTMADGSRKMIEVACLDLKIDWLNRDIHEIPIQNQGNIVLISSQGQFLSSRFDDWIGRRRITQLITSCVWMPQLGQEPQMQISGAEKYMKLNPKLSPAGQKLLAEYKDSVTEYTVFADRKSSPVQPKIQESGAGYYILNVEPAGITADFYPGNTTEKPAWSLRLR